MIKQDRALDYNQQSTPIHHHQSRQETSKQQIANIAFSDSQAQKNANPLAIYLHAMTPPKLEKRFTMRIFLSQENTHDLGAMRNGPRRYIAAITRGSIKGEGIEAELLPGGADWVSVCIHPS